MGECRFVNATGQSIDPWCAEHNRSAILCLRWMRIERDEALRRLAEHEWYARATCEEPRACGECAGCAELRRRAEAGEMWPPTRGRSMWERGGAE